MRQNSKRQQQSQQDSMKKKYRLVDEESEVDIEEEQNREDMAMVSVDVENEAEGAYDDEIPSDVGELDEIAQSLIFLMSFHDFAVHNLFYMFCKWTRVDLVLLRKEFMCPICLGILKETKTFNDCLHRFCGECINKALNSRKGCPSCRKSYGTNRVLRDDPNMDSIIALVFGDLSKYEAENNRDTQERDQEPSVTLTEGINNIGNTSARPSTKRFSNGQENAHPIKRARKPRTRKRYGNQSKEIEHDPIIQNEHQQDQMNEIDINRNAGDENKGDDDEITAKIMQLRSKRLKRISQDSTDTILDVEQNTSGGGVVPRNPQSSSVATRIKNARLTKLSKHLHLSGQRKKKDDQFEIHVKLVSLNRDIEDLENPHLFCSPTLSFQYLREVRITLNFFLVYYA
ncbi:hypothetical protein OSB04_008066 [Centaurea solstitialis]|uniref:RING-type domain-containing protein n=1 Tax=Centaurea solstitialis TaxID=347529 RepID=A0AA38TYU6_9ASTR|nr:hypothetical protein OSB04_008066 [Centaurea solstitialis]